MHTKKLKAKFSDLSAKEIYGLSANLKLKKSYKNRIKSQYLIEMASILANREAQNYLFFLFKNVVKDDHERIEWLKKAAEHEHVKAQYYLGLEYIYGNILEKDGKQAFIWFMKAAKQGHSGAQYELGQMYRFVTGENNVKEANKWYQKAAEQGHPDAHFFVGLEYLSKKVDNADKIAFRCFKNAAKKGNIDAQYGLGLMYYNGRGKKRNIKKAYNWLTKAKNAGSEDAKCLLKNLNELTTPEVLLDKFNLNTTNDESVQNSVSAELARV